MKRLFCLIIVLFLFGCSNDVSVFYELKEDNYYAYAVNIKTNEIKKVNIEFEINDYEDIFLLYTRYQNYFPIGYSVFSHCNISLIDTYIKDKDIYYIVDNYILLVENIELFQELLTKTNAIYGYGKAHFINNGNILA